MKKCSKCLEEKPLDSFPLRKISKDGRYSWCKICSSNISNEYRKKNPEKYKAGREKRKEKALAKAREWKRKNKEYLKKYKKKYVSENYEKVLGWAKNYYKSLTEQQKKNKKEYYRNWAKKESSKKYHFVRNKVYRAVKNGEIVKSEKCMICGSFDNIEAHHADYEKPLQVLWVCKTCHGKIHRKG